MAPGTGDSGRLASAAPSRPYIPRFTAATARKRWSEADRAHLVIGPRQAGKSTALWTYLAERGEPAREALNERRGVRFPFGMPPSLRVSSRSDGARKKQERT